MTTVSILLGPDLLNTAYGRDMVPVPVSCCVTRRASPRGSSCCARMNENKMFTPAPWDIEEQFRISKKKYIHYDFSKAE